MITPKSKITLMLLLQVTDTGKNHIYSGMKEQASALKLLLKVFKVQ